MKHLYKLISCIFVLLLLCSCGGETSPDAQPDEENPITVVIPQKPQVDLSSWELILVNRDNPLEGEPFVSLKSVKFGYAPMGYSVDERIYTPLEAMFAAAKEDGINLYLTSAYRSVEKQQQLYDNKINYYLGKGYSIADATRLAEEVLSIPGRSEHHTGLAVDITSEQWIKQTGGELLESFESSPAGIWLAENCADYGFILRYPKNKESITKISYEPWHLRYVGVENAKYMNEHGMCLEEFIEYFQK